MLMPSGLVRAFLLLIAAIATIAAAPPASAAVDAGAVDRCHQSLLRGLAAVSRGRIALVGRCLKEDNWQACPENDLHALAHENELRAFVAGPSSKCRDAVDSGASVADFGPTSCSAEWEGCDVEVPVVATLEDIAECLICQQRGYDFRLRAILGLPRPMPSDAEERRCTKSVARLVSKTIRLAIFDSAACAAGETKPFACAVDATSGSRFGRALAKFGRTIARCRVDEGRAPGALAAFCDGATSDAAGLTACFTATARCLACRSANSALGQSQDCVAFSGLADCDGAL
jgi:hypothetical protein